MATSKDFMNYVESKLTHIPGIRSRSMFGEYGFYCGDAVVGFVCDETVFLKITEHTTELFGSDVEKGPAYPGSKDYYIVTEAMLEDQSLMKKVIEACRDDVLASKKKKKK